MDFFALSKILPALLYPLPLFLILTMVGLLLWPKLTKRRWLKPALWVLVASLWVISTPAFSRWLTELWEAPRLPTTALAAHYDAAVVLGGLSQPDVSTPDHTEFNGRVERLLEAIELYRAGRVSKLLITSGTGDLLNPADKEAPYLKRSALRLGVAEADLIIEDQSRNTYENSRLSKPLADRAGLKKVLLITSAFHMKRSAAIFKKQGWDFDPWPVDTMVTKPSAADILPSPASLDNVQALLKEMAGYVVYGWTGYL